MFYIDGMKCDAKCALSRTSDIRSSEISGEMMDGSYFNDVLGTWLQYDVSLNVPMYSSDRYADIYEALNAPVEGHDFVFPYNNGLIAIFGRVQGLKDNHEELPGGKKYWTSLSFSVIANHPTKQPTLAEVLVRGRSPLPDISMPSIGDTYTYTANGWVKVENQEDEEE